MSVRIEDLTAAQGDALRRLRRELGATAWIADRDEQHDATCASSSTPTAAASAST